MNNRSQLSPSYTSQLSLSPYENQYTFLRSSIKSRNSTSDHKDLLMQFSKNLKIQTPKLPKIRKINQSNTTRKIQKDIDQINFLLRKKKKYERQALSEHRNLNVLPLNMMPPVQMVQPLQMMMPSNMNQYPPHQFPPQYPHNPLPPPQLLPPPQEQTEKQQNEDPKKIPSSEKKRKNIPTFQKKSLLNRFRICAYAVYFTIFIKYFHKRFTENRRNWFNDRYKIDDGKVVLDRSTKVLKILHDIDMQKMLEDAKKGINTRKQDVQKSSKKLDKQRTLINFIDLLLQFTEQLMTSQSFIEENHEVFTVGVLNQNFVISNLYTPQETALLSLHPAGYIHISEQTQILILMLKIVIKILVFNYLLGLKFSKKWNVKQEKTYNLDQTELQALWEMARMAGVFLTIVCQQIYDVSSKTITQHSNWNEMKDRFGIENAKSLEQIDKKKVEPNSSCAMIKYLGGYEALKEQIAKTPILKNYKEELKPRIIDMLTKIYTCLKFEEEKVYDFVHQMTLDEEYVIFKGKKKEKQDSKKRRKKAKNNGVKGLNDQSQYGENQSAADNKNTKKSIQNTKASKMNKQGKVDKQNPINQGKQKKQVKYSGFAESKSNIQNQTLNAADSSINSISNKWGLDEQSESEEQEENNGKNKKMKYKHQQAFYDHKFEGHSKLEKLKNRMKLLQTKKVL